ncbi:DUF7269 family protein [Haloarchaeobius amylolyticus]|uniref:DUF7269 family protein n=1 Tax=Haloarchaeobius amylolyticus TaxID=1198296 RepID=UPI002270D248|nr:hypothetical protein [Haloarchaeobius amylolyticus]
MNRRRFLTAVLGVLALVAGVTALGSDLGEPVAETLLAALGNDYVVAAAVAGLGLLVAVPVLLSARASTLDQATMPKPEESLTKPAPGDDFDETLTADVLMVPHVSADRRETVREDLRESAVAVVAQATGTGRHEAAERVRQGTWTDDEAVARFLAESGDQRSPGSSLTARLRALAGGDSPFQHRARRTARAIADRAENGGRSR